MFTKNIKTIAIVAVALVIAILVSCLVAVNNDKKVAEQVAGQVQQNANNAQSEIDKLNKTIADLKDALAKAEQGLADAAELAAAQDAVIKALEENGVKLDQWNEATEVVIDKLVVMTEIIEEFYASCDDNEFGLTFDEIYGYALVEADLMPETIQVAVRIARATSVEAIDAILADFQAFVDAIPTRLERLYADMAAIEADGITYDDAEAIENAYYDFFGIRGEIFAAPTEEALGEKEVIYNRLNDMVLAWRDAAAAEFIDQVNALPTYWELLDTDEDAAIAAADVFYDMVYAYNTPMFGDEYDKLVELVESEEMAAAIETLDAAIERIYNVAEIRERAELVNALIDEDYEIGADADSFAYVSALKVARDHWFAGQVNEFLAAKWLVVYTDVEDERYNETIYNFVDHAAIDAAIAAYDEAVAHLVSAFQSFIDAVDAIGEVTLESEAALDAALDAYLVCLDGVDADAALFDILVDAEEGKGLNDYYAEYHALRLEYNKLAQVEIDKNVLIEVTNKLMHDYLLNCEDKPVVDKDGNPVLDKDGNPTYEHVCGDLNKDVRDLDINEIEVHFIKLYTVYGADLSVLNADYVALYYQARLLPEMAAACDKIDAALAAYVGHEKYAELALSAETQKAAVNAVSYEGYEFWTVGEDGILTLTVDAGSARIAALVADDFIAAQFNAIINAD